MSAPVDYLPLPRAKPLAGEESRPFHWRQASPGESFARGKKSYVRERPSGKGECVGLAVVASGVWPKIRHCWWIWRSFWSR
jgi:hypothetical protein